MSRLRLALAVCLPIAAVIVAISELSENEILSVLGVPATGVTVPILSNRLAQVVRLCAGLFVLSLLLAYMAFRPERRRVSSTPSLIPHDTAMDQILGRLDVHENAKYLAIWGYSLNWAGPLSSFIEHSPRRQLVVRIFVPGDEVLERHGTDRRPVLALRLDEWRHLEEAGLIRKLSVHRESCLPNDLGVMLDNEIGFIGTYDWEIAEAGEVHHHRVPKRQRERFLLDSKSDVARFLVRHTRSRLACRQCDAPMEPGRKEVT